MSQVVGSDWRPGDVVVARDIMFDTVFHARPMRAVSAEDGIFASHLPIGTEYFGLLYSDRDAALDEFSRGELRWGLRRWVEHNVLVLVRENDPYSIMGLWKEDGAFVTWYVNLQDPLRWSRFGYDTRDHALDIIVGEDLASWLWKDEHELEALTGMGLFSPDEARDIRKAGEAVIDLVESGRTWWGKWRDWAPDPSWPPPTLPDGWDRV